MNAFSKLIICIIAIASAGIPTAAGRISNLFRHNFLTNMRLIKLFTICTALITTVFTVAAAEPVKDTASVQKTAAVSNHTISMQILGLEYGYEQKLGGSFSMVFRAGLVPAGIIVIHDYFSSGFAASMKIGANVEPRFYTNFDRRQRLGKSTYKNSADFVALKIQAALGGVFVSSVSDDGDISFSSPVEVSLTPMYGIRRVWGKNWFGEFSVGARIGWQTDWYVAPYIQYRIGLAF